MTRKDKESIGFKLMVLQIITTIVTIVLIAVSSSITVCRALLAVFLIIVAFWQFFIAFLAISGLFADSSYKKGGSDD